jgi:hypothetical protein
MMGDLADRRGLSRAVDPNDHDRVDPLPRDPQRGLVLPEDRLHLVPEDLPEDLRAAQFLAPDLVLKGADELGGKGRPHVGHNKGLFQFVEERLVVLLAAEDQVVHVRQEQFARFGKP